MKNMSYTLTALLISFFLSSCTPNQQTFTPGLLASNVTVTKNPYRIAPLTAEAVFQTKVPTQVSIEILGEEPVVHQFRGRSKEHRLPILGLYPGTENRVIISMTTAEGEVDEDTFTVSTEPLPDFFPNIDVTTADTKNMEAGWNFSQYSVNESGLPAEGEEAIQGRLRSLPFMFDSSGDIRYYLDLVSIGGVVYEIGRLRNGNWVFGHASNVYEYDMLGKEIHRWAIPGFTAHHETVEKPDGNLLIAVHKAGTKNREGTPTNGDHIIELERTSGEVVNEWDLREVVDVYRHDLVNNEVDWFHMNAIWYDEADDTLIVSGRDQGLVKLTKNNELVWILAPHKGWGKAGIDADKYDTANYLLTAVDAQGTPYPEGVQQGDENAPDFGWVWGQHAPLVLPNGHLFVFDNGFRRNFGPNGETSFSRGVEYAIDESAMTVRQVWEYGQERGNTYFSPIISDVDYLPRTGNRLIMPGIARVGDAPGAYVTEVSYSDGNVVFDAGIRFRGFFRTETFFGEIVYRSERLSIYP